MAFSPLRSEAGPPSGAGAPGHTATPPWWTTVPARRRTPYAFLAFPPATPAEAVAALATEAIGATGGWQASTDPDEGWYAWRRGTSGPMLTMVVAGHLPVIVVMGPGSAAGAPAQAGIASLITARAAGAAQQRFVRVARQQGARVISTAALSGLVAQSAARCARWDAISHRLAQIAEEERTRACPRCDAGCLPSARWCPRCEYEFGQGDDHARDRAVLERRREADELRRVQAHLAAEAFPPLPMPSLPGPPVSDRGGPR